MVAIDYERRAIDLGPNANAEHCYRLIAQKADHTSGGKPAEMQYWEGMDT